jgi:hypothetical protein
MTTQSDFDALPAAWPRRGVAGATALPLGAALAACIVLAACATKPPAAQWPKTVRGASIAAYAIHEDCLQLRAGERLDYEFTTNNPVDFNIHYHEGRTVLMPIVHDKSEHASGVYVPAIPQDYCLMWEAGAAGALLDYRINLRAPPT